MNRQKSHISNVCVFQFFPCESDSLILITDTDETLLASWNQISNPSPLEYLHFGTSNWALSLSKPRNQSPEGYHKSWGPCQGLCLAVSDQVSRNDESAESQKPPERFRQITQWSDCNPRFGPQMTDPERSFLMPCDMMYDDVNLRNHRNLSK